jgi:protein-tyrosine phosphatase
MDEDKKISVMFVCLGNICRSPLAEAAFRKEVAEAGLEEVFDVKSSGTGHWHVGGQADQRMRETAGKFGLSLEAHRAQQFLAGHIADFDHVLVMDKSNLHDVLFLDRKEKHGTKVRLFREFDPDPGDFQVPDPYYGGPQGFDAVCQIVQRTAQRLLECLIDEYELDTTKQV